MFVHGAGSGEVCTCRAELSEIGLNAGHRIFFPSWILRMIAQ